MTDAKDTEITQLKAALADVLSAIEEAHPQLDDWLEVGRRYKVVLPPLVRAYRDNIHYTQEEAQHAEDHQV